MFRNIFRNKGLFKIYFIKYIVKYVFEIKIINFEIKKYIKVVRIKK